MIASSEVLTANAKAHPILAKRMGVVRKNPDLGLKKL
jgi:hypothetical protein